MSSAAKARAARVERPFASYEPDAEALRADVESLCSITRGSAGPGERAAASWARDRLAALGVSEPAVEPFRGRATNSWSFAAHSLAGLAALRLGGGRGAALALGSLASLERDASGAWPWRRRPFGPLGGANAVARIPARGKAHATAVLVAHIDAARTGLAWHPRVTQNGAARHLRTHHVEPVMGLQGAALAAAAAYALLLSLRADRTSGPRTVTRVRRALGGFALAINAAALALNLDIARSPVVPGANDNATGVAAVLDVARALAADPLENVDVLIALVGCEESGMGGMSAFLGSRAETLTSRSTLVLSLDTLGSGTPLVAAAEGAIRTHHYREQDLALADEGAALAGEPAPQRWRIGAWTDPLIALRAGLPSISMLSIGPGYYPHYHHPSDLPEHVDWDCVASCARIAHGTLRALNRRSAAC